MGSDGSTDETDKIVQEFAAQGVKFFDFETNRGKTAVQNDLVAHSTGDLLVFTDAASFLKKDALGITGSLRWTDSGGTIHVIAFDVLLDELFGIVTEWDFDKDRAYVTYSG